MRGNGGRARPNDIHIFFSFVKLQSNKKKIVWLSNWLHSEEHVALAKLDFSRAKKRHRNNLWLTFMPFSHFGNNVADSSANQFAVQSQRSFLGGTKTLLPRIQEWRPKNRDVHCESWAKFPRFWGEGQKKRKKKGRHSKICEKTILAHEFWRDNQ